MDTLDTVIRLLETHQKQTQTMIDTIEGRSSSSISYPETLQNLLTQLAEAHMVVTACTLSLANGLRLVQLGQAFPPAHNNP